LIWLQYIVETKRERVWSRYLNDLVERQSNYSHDEGTSMVQPPGEDFRSGAGDGFVRCHFGHFR